jgi:hypothetical protein
MRELVQILTVVVPLLALLGLLATAIVHFAFAIAVHSDAEDCRKSSRLYFVGPATWFLVTLFGGVPAAAIYWLMHRSTLNPAVGRRKASHDGALEPSRAQIEEELYINGLLRPGRQVDDSAVEQFLDS